MVVSGINPLLYCNGLPAKPWGFMTPANLIQIGLNWQIRCGNLRDQTLPVLLRISGKALGFHDPQPILCRLDLILAKSILVVSGGNPPGRIWHGLGGNSLEGLSSWPSLVMDFGWQILSFVYWTGGWPIDQKNDNDWKRSINRGKSWEPKRSNTQVQTKDGCYLPFDLKLALTTMKRPRIVDLFWQSKKCNEEIGAI